MIKLTLLVLWAVSTLFVLFVSKKPGWREVWADRADVYMWMAFALVLVGAPIFALVDVHEMVMRKVFARSLPGAFEGDEDDLP
jgi:hypothetical protein